MPDPPKVALQSKVLTRFAEFEAEPHKNKGSTLSDEAFSLS